MFGLKAPAVAAVGVAAVLAFGGAAVTEQAVADEGGGGAGSSASTGSDGPDGWAADAGSSGQADLSGAADTSGTSGTSDAPDAADVPDASGAFGASDAPDLSGASGASGAPGGSDGPGAGSDAGSGASYAPDSSGWSDAARTMEVSPRTVAPGGEVTLHLAASCAAGKKAKASAQVFVDTVTLAPADDGNGLQGSAFIKSDAADGSYAISVDCDGATSTASASITVTAGGLPTSPAANPIPGVPNGPKGPGGPPSPVRPVPAGGGGTAQLAAGPTALGGSTGPLLVTGGCAVLGLAGLLIRRRRGSVRG
ncbi:hypothetical protein [Streptomyces sp. NBC_01190]|uniref:hypothetical protein n=1 Tax=Streptomyces sp. NBC_01190 TaxID=2903767 RepID=UPI00386C26CF|nr:hypothetical protein OG519_11130 [Streptomyces sp. NBC_01190]